MESKLDLAHDVTRRAIEEWPQGRPIGVQRAMQKIIAEQIGLCCTGISPGAYINQTRELLGRTLTAIEDLDAWEFLPARDRVFSTGGAFSILSRCGYRAYAFVLGMRRRKGR